MRTLFSILLSILAMTVQGCFPEESMPAPKGMAGTWLGHCSPINSWCEAEKLEVRYVIHPGGKIEGHVGGAELVNARVELNDDLSRAFDNPDHCYHADLKGALVESEDISRDTAIGLLEMEGNVLTGQVVAHGNLLFLMDPKDNDDFYCNDLELRPEQVD